MPKGYWIGRVDVNDEEAYKPYAAANPAIFRRYGGRFVVRAGRFECPEGTSRTRNVVIEFPDYAAALRPRRSRLEIARAIERAFELFGRPYSDVLDQAMRGPSDWSIGERELFAAFVSSLNQCPF